MTVVTGLKCNVWLAGSQYYGAIDISLESALRWWLGVLVGIATLAMCARMLEQTAARVWHIEV